jgi:hypothetical protein
MCVLNFLHAIIVLEFFQQAIGIFVSKVLELNEHILPVSGESIRIDIENKRYSLLSAGLHEIVQELIVFGPSDSISP